MKATSVIPFLAAMAAAVPAVQNTPIPSPVPDPPVERDLPVVQTTHIPPV